MQANLIRLVPAAIVIHMAIDIRRIAINNIIPFQSFLKSYGKILALKNKVFCLQ